MARQDQPSKRRPRRIEDVVTGQLLLERVPCFPQRLDRLFEQRAARRR